MSSSVTSSNSNNNNKVEDGDGHYNSLAAASAAFNAQLLQRFANTTVTTTSNNNSTSTTRGPHRVQPKVCAFCHKVWDEPLPTCQGCHMLAYCDEHCQRSHWKASHKVQCQGLAKRFPEFQPTTTTTTTIPASTTTNASSNNKASETNNNKLKLHPYGVSLKFLQSLFQQDKQYRKKTTQQLVDEHLAKTVKASSLAEEMLNDPERSMHVQSVADFYLVHSWRNCWCDLVEALTNHYGSLEREYFFFIDVVCVNYDRAQDFSPDLHLQTLDVISKIDDTRVILIPNKKTQITQMYWEMDGSPQSQLYKATFNMFDGPYVFASAWCLFEMYHSLENGICTEFHIGDKDRALLHLAIKGGFINFLYCEALTHFIDFRRAACFGNKQLLLDTPLMKDSHNRDYAFRRLKNAVFRFYMNFLSLQFLHISRLRSMDFLHFLQVYGKFFSAYDEQHEKGVEIYLQALEICEQRKMDACAEYGDVLDSLGSLYVSLHNFDKAKQYLTRALEVRQKVLGPYHILVGDSLNLLASLAFQKRQLEEAKVRFMESLRVKRIALGNFSSEVSITLNNLAEVMRLLYEVKEAKPMYEESLAILKEIVRPSEPIIATALSNTGDLYRTLKDFVGARKCLDEALEINARYFGYDSAAVATCLNNIGMLLQDEKQYKQAKKKHEEALAIRRKVFGNKHEDVAASLKFLSQTLLSLGDKAGSARCTKEANDIGLHLEKSS